MIRNVLFCLLLPSAAWSASPQELEQLHAALQTDELMAILSEEGIEQGEELQSEMFPGRGGIGWAATIEQIYAPERLRTVFREAFDDALVQDDISPLLDFYSGEPGALIAKLEVEARRAIMAEDVEEAARSAYTRIVGEESPRVELLDQFAEINDLIDRNVAGALNSNLAFYRGLGSGDGFEMTEDQMLRDVWEQEPEIREDTTGWIFGYMTFAYEALSDDELRTYVEMTATDAGRDLNRALFAGFDAVFLDVSYALGAATAQFSVGEDL